MLIMVCYFKRICVINQAEDPSHVTRSSSPAHDRAREFPGMIGFSAWLRIRAQPWNPCQPRNSASASTWQWQSWSWIVDTQIQAISHDDDQMFKQQNEMPKLTINIVMDSHMYWKTEQLVKVRKCFRYNRQKTWLFIIVQPQNTNSSLMTDRLAVQYFCVILAFNTSHSPFHLDLSQS